jgi:Xaa-Pro aminopeptidase
MFDAEFYTTNRSALTKRLKTGVVVIAGNALMQRTGDTNFAFRQDSDFVYLTGVTEPRACLVIDIDAGIEFIMVDKNTGVTAIFDGIFDSEEITKISGITDIRSYRDGFKHLSELSKVKKLYFNETKMRFISDTTLNGFRQSIKKRLTVKGLKTQDVRQYIAELRMIKQPQEIAAISQAVEITKRSLKKVEAHIVAAKNEQDLLHVLNMQFISQNSVHSFGPLVQAGANTTILHYEKSNQPLIQNGVVLLDVGAEVAHYAADISRTYIKGDNTQASDIIKAVQFVQAEIINMVKPGVTWRDISMKALELTAEQLIQLKIITNKNDVHKYFPHAIGHFLGLDVHDVGDYTKPLAENMVITVEPGIYIPEIGIGVRIEDDILVTKTGAKVL